VHVVLPEGAVKAAAFQKQVSHLAGDLDAAEAGANHHDRQQALFDGRVGLDLCLLQKPDKVVAENEGVAHRLERKAVGGHAGNDVEVDHRAAGQDEVVVSLLGDPAVGGAVLDGAGGQVDARQGSGTADRAAGHLADGPDDVHRVDG